MSAIDEQQPTLNLTGNLDPRDGWEAKLCPIAKAMEVVGTRSAFILLREAFYGTTRFDDFAARTGLSEAVTAARLRELAGEGLLDRRPYREPGQRTRYEYHLTEMGADLFPALAALFQWGDRWLRPAGIEMRHHSCGGAVHAELHCAAGHQVGVCDIDLVARASASTTASS
ncbi:MAG TPA: helix-turn-helix domain-containing protein [Streptosporangiaceae bacterium]|jgi:DNA-binding HxlR family transcriptional regulator